ncbi:MAG: ABC transporter ATP-binding protein [Pseudomonadota bacterium]
MIEIRLENVTLTYPMLGGGVRKKLGDTAALVGAGSVVTDDDDRGRSIVALSDISLHLKEGARVGLIGRNGSGKSTLLRVMAGIYEPLTGRVGIAGEVASLFNVGLGMKPEASGYRNIELAGLMAGQSHKAIAEKLPEIADFSELGQYLNMPVRTYSSGMAMRLKFACATAFSPDILLMDEWLGAGDAAFQEKAKQRMATMVQNAGILVLASHSVRLITDNCDKAIWLDRGRMAAFGPVDDVLAEMSAQP